MAVPDFEIHHLQLPKFKEVDLDLAKPLHLWLRALCLAQDGDKLMREVVMGEPELKAYYEADPGFRQFVDRHRQVAGDPAFHKEYKKWLREEMLWAQELKDITDEARDEGRA